MPAIRSDHRLRTSVPARAGLRAFGQPARPRPEPPGARVRLHRHRHDDDRAPLRLQPSGRRQRHDHVRPQQPAPHDEVQLLLRRPQGRRLLPDRTTARRIRRRFSSNSKETSARRPPRSDCGTRPSATPAPSGSAACRSANATSAMRFSTFGSCAMIVIGTSWVALAPVTMVAGWWSPSTIITRLLSCACSHEARSACSASTRSTARTRPSPCSRRCHTADGDLTLGRHPVEDRSIAHRVPVDHAAAAVPMVCATRPGRSRPSPADGSAASSMR